jgi:hypothetical protein
MVAIDPIFGILAFPVFHRLGSAEAGLTTNAKEG